MTDTPTPTGHPPRPGGVRRVEIVFDEPERDPLNAAGAAAIAAQREVEDPSVPLRARIAVEHLIAAVAQIANELRVVREAHRETRELLERVAES